MHCRADRGLHGSRKRPWPLSRGGMDMSARAHSLPCRQSFMTNGSCKWRLCKVSLSCFFLSPGCFQEVSRLTLRQVEDSAWVVSRRDTACRPSAWIPGGCDCYIGTACKQQGLKRSDFANPHKVSSTGALRRYADSRLRWRKTRTYARRFGYCPVAAWFVTVRQNRSATLMFLSRNTSSRAFKTVTFNSSALDLLSCLREEPDSTDGSSADETAPTKTAGWADTQSRHCGRQVQSRSWTSRAGTGRQPFSLNRAKVKSQSRRLKKREWRDSRSKLSEHCGPQVSPALAQRGGGSGGQPRRLRSRSPCPTGGAGCRDSRPFTHRRRSGVSSNSTTAQTISHRSTTKKQRGERMTPRSNRGWRESWKSWKTSPQEVKC